MSLIVTVRDNKNGIRNHEKCTEWRYLRWATTSFHSPFHQSHRTPLRSSQHCCDSFSNQMKVSLLITERSANHTKRIKWKIRQAIRKITSRNIIRFELNISIIPSVVRSHPEDIDILWLRRRWSSSGFDRSEEHGATITDMSKIYKLFYGASVPLQP